MLGAIVGATAGGTVEAVLEGRREAARAKAGARLVAGDLAMADSRLKSIEGDRKWWVFMELKIRAWEEYRDVLAVRLSNEEFEAVSQAVVGLTELGDKMPSDLLAKHGGRFIKLQESAVEAFGPIRREAADAYNALSELGGHPRVEGTIHGDADSSETSGGGEISGQPA